MPAIAKMAAPSQRPWLPANTSTCSNAARPKKANTPANAPTPGDNQRQTARSGNTPLSSIAGARLNASRESRPGPWKEASLPPSSQSTSQQRPQATCPWYQHRFPLPALARALKSKPVPSAQESLSAPEPLREAKAENDLRDCLRSSQTLYSTSEKNAFEFAW